MFDSKSWNKTIEQRHFFALRVFTYEGIITLSKLTFKTNNFYIFNKKEGMMKLNRTYNMLLIGVMIIWNSTLIAQSYLPMAKDSAVWFLTAADNVLVPVEKYVVFTNGDTTIDQKEYKKVYFRGANEEGFQLVGGIRDDKSARKVYALIFSYDLGNGLSLDENCPLHREYLLYDFSVRKNDIVSSACNHSQTVTDTTVSYVFNYGRKVVNLDEINQRWYEGIGSWKGLFNNFIAHSSYELTDYCEGSLEDCSVPLFLNTDYIPINKSGKIFPNPTFTQFTLQLNKDIYNAKIVVSDIYGQQVSNFTQMNGNEKEISTNHLASGVYFIEVLKQGRIIFKDKILIAK